MCVQPAHTPGVDQLLREYAQTHDPRIREAIIARQERLAYAIALRFRNNDVPLEDLVQIALIGLVYAVDRFDPSRHTNFSTYAVPTIMGEIRRHFRDCAWSFHVPRGLKDAAQRVWKAERRLSARLGRSPTIPELAEELNTSEEGVVEAMAIWETRQMLPLHGRRGTTTAGDAGLIEEIIGANYPGLDEVEIRVSLDQALKRLPPTLRQVLRLRYLEGLSQKAAGERLGFSQMHVSRLERRALDALQDEYLASDKTPRSAS